MNGDIKEWFFNLNCLYNHIVNALNSHIDLYKHLDAIGEELLSDVDAIFISYILIYTNSITDEYHLNDDATYLELRKVCKPVFNYINKKWPDIKVLRNNVLAHNHRNKENKSIHFTRNLLNYRVPNGNVEIELLVYLLGLVIEATNKCYRYDYDTIASLLSNDELIYTPMNASESNKIKIDIKNQMNDQLRVFNANKN